MSIPHETAGGGCADFTCRTPHLESALRENDWFREKKRKNFARFFWHADVPNRTKRLIVALWIWGQFRRLDPNSTFIRSFCSTLAFSTQARLCPRAP